MAGQLTIDTLKASSGVLATQNGMTGIAKAWVTFDATTTAPTINNSFNISSVTKTGTGLFYCDFTTAMPNTTYSLVGSTSVRWGDGCPVGTQFNANGSAGWVAPTTSRFYMATWSSTPSFVNYNSLYNYVSVFSTT